MGEGKGAKKEIMEGKKEGRKKEAGERRAASLLIKDE